MHGLLFNCAYFTSLASMAPSGRADSMLRWTCRYIGSSQNCRCCYRVMLTLLLTILHVRITLTRTTYVLIGRGFFLKPSFRMLIRMAKVRWRGGNKRKSEHRNTGTTATAFSGRSGCSHSWCTSVSAQPTDCCCCY